MAPLVHTFQCHSKRPACHQLPLDMSMQLKWHARDPQAHGSETHPALLAAGLIENLTVDVYGDKVPLRSLGAISVRDAQTLLVSPWDKGVRLCRFLFCKAKLEISRICECAVAAAILPCGAARCNHRNLPPCLLVAWHTLRIPMPQGPDLKWCV